MTRRTGAPRRAGLRPAEKTLLLLTALALALTLARSLGTRRAAPELSVRQEGLPAPSTRALPMQGGRIDVNRATEAELRELDGVGEALARRIVEYREEHGPFRRTEDITAVRGIGSAIYEANRDRICVGEGNGA